MKLKMNLVTEAIANEMQKSTWWSIKLTSWLRIIAETFLFTREMK